MHEPLPKLSPLIDVVFRRLFDDPALLSSLLNAILHLSGAEALVELTVLPTQVTGDLADDKEVVLDLRAQTRGGRQLHVEVQLRAFVAYAARMLYYWAGLYHGQLGSGEGYDELEPVISIHILGFNLLPEELHPRYHHAFELREQESHHRLSDHLQLHTVEVPKFLRAMQAGRASTDEERWLYFLVYGHELSAEQVRSLGLPAIARADEELRVISQDRILRAQYEARVKAQRDAIAWEKDHIAEWLREGKRQGLDEGKRLGLDEGKRQGLDEGKRLGLDEGKRLGLDEGKREGERSTKQRDILQILEARGLAVSEDLRRQILACEDLGRLERCFLRAVTAARAEDVLAD